MWLRRKLISVNGDFSYYKKKNTVKIWRYPQKCVILHLSKPSERCITGKAITLRKVYNWQSDNPQKGVEMTLRPCLLKGKADNNKQT